MKTVLAAVALALAAALPAQAQINPFGKWGSTSMTKEDQQMTSQAAASLYQNPAVKKGDIAKWENPASGNSGTVTVTRLFQSKDMPCVGLLYSFNIKDTQDKSKKELQSNRCKVASGEWKILN